MEWTEAESIDWNRAVERLHAALARDSSVQGTAVTTTPTVEMLIVVEPGTALEVPTVAAIEAARVSLPVRVVDGRTRGVDLDRARRAIEAAAPHVRLSEGTKGVLITTDWIEGKVRLTGDAEGGEAIVSRADVDRGLVIVEDGPAIRRLPRRRTEPPRP